MRSQSRSHALLLCLCASAFIHQALALDMVWAGSENAAMTGTLYSMLFDLKAYFVSRNFKHYLLLRLGNWDDPKWLSPHIPTDEQSIGMFPFRPPGRGDDAQISIADLGTYTVFSEEEEKNECRHLLIGNVLDRETLQPLSSSRTAVGQILQVRTK